MSQNIKKSPIVNRWFRSQKNDAQYEARQRLAVVQFFPGNGLVRFESPIQPFGIGVLALLCYRLVQQGTRLLHETVFRGFTGFAHSDGSVEYGGERGCEFNYDLSRRPMPGARGRVMDLDRLSGLIIRGLGMDRAVDRHVSETYRLPIKPEMPRILLGFGSGLVPEFVDTEGLRRLAARRMGCTIKQLEKKCGRVSLLDYLRQLYQELVIEPGEGGNTTGCYLLPAEVCDRASTAAVFEDYTELLGVQTWNPARDAANPAGVAMKICKIDPRHVADVDQDTLDRLMAEMRGALGSCHDAFSEDDLCHALLHPAEPLKNSEHTVWTAMGDADYMARLRSLLDPAVAEQATNDDLRAAAADLRAPLVLTGACRPQVIQLQKLELADALHWTPEVLGLKIDANLGVDHIRQRNRKGHAPREDAQPRMAYAVGSATEAHSELAG